MKKFMKALAAILTVATFATIPAMAEETAANTNAVIEAQTSANVESLFGTDIEEAAAALGLKKTQTQGEGEDGAYLTLYENEGICLGARDGVIVYISLFNNSYDIYGVKLGMTAEDAKAALTDKGVEYTDGAIDELDIKTIDFKMPGYANAQGSFELSEDNKIVNANIETIVDTEEENAANEEETTETEETGKATDPVKETGYIKLTGDAHLRKSADKESSSLKVMSKGTKLKYTATAKDSRGVTWYKVTKSGKTGWVSSKNTTKIKKSEYNNSGKTSPKKASGYIKLTGKCNVRKSPDKSSKKLDTFAKGSVLAYTATAKDSRGVTWYKVTADGVTGWISSKNAKKTK